MKQIKFDLPIDGTKVRNIEELRDHFSTEILDLYKNGLLVKWLINQRYSDYAQAVERLLPTETDANLLKLLCGIFEIDVDFEIIQQLADYHGNGIKIDPEQLQYKQKYKKSIQDTPIRKKIMGFDNEFICSSVDIEIIIKMHKYHTGEDILLVPIVASEEFKEEFCIYFDDYKKSFTPSIGDKIKIRDRIFFYQKNTYSYNDYYEVVSPCDGILYKKTFPFHKNFFTLGHSNNDYRLQHIYIDQYSRILNKVIIGYLRVDV